MFHKTFRSALTATLVAAAALVAPGCAETSQPEDQPRQFVELGIHTDEVREMLIVTELIHDTDVADFLIYKVSVDDAERFDRLSAACANATDGLVDVPCGTCQCTHDGQILCADYTCDDTFASFTWPASEQTEVEPSLDDLVAEPPAPEPDPGARLQPAPLPEGGADQLTSDPPFCEDGHVVGQSWIEGPNTCWCTPQRTVACTLVGDPITPTPY